MQITFLDASTLGNTDLSPLKSLGTLTTHPTSTPAEALQRVANTEIIITNKVVITEEIINAAPNLKLILTAATGTNHVNLTAASQKNIPVCNVAGYSTPTVAQHVFTLILILATATHLYNNEQTLWPKSEIFTRLDHHTFDLEGKTLGIIGLGAIGKKVAQIARAFDMNVIALQSQNPSNKSNTDTPRLPLKELLNTADIITLHCPLTENTKHLINSETLAQMKPSALLINTGRGPLINEPDLLAALQNKTIAGAGLDVLSQEPPEMTNCLITNNLPNLIITPHTAWASTEARNRLLQGLCQNIKDHLTGTHPNKVN